MNKNRPFVALLALTVILAACLPGGTESTTTTTEQATASSTTLGTGTTGPLRTVEEVDCDSAPESVAIVCEAYELIETHYVDEIDDTTLAAAAAQGLETMAPATSTQTLICALPADEFEASCDAAASVSGDSSEAAEAMVIGLTTHALDPNSAYFDSKALELLEEEQEGEIEGIGALVSPEDETIEGDNKQCTLISETCRIFIVSTIDGAPADGAGLQRDDVIVAVNGDSIDGWTIDEVTATVRGPAGTDVTLTIDRAGNEFDVTITRAAVVIPVLRMDRFGDVGYIQLSVFSHDADEKFEQALIDLLKQGVDELVIDLRDNPGGLLDTAVEIASVFLPDGDVIVTQSPDESTTYPVTGAAIVPDDMNVVFVVNKGSASASEVVSAVLQERGRATIVGESTFGKNTVQQRFGLSNGGALKLTVARWVTPGGLDFGGVGVTPDVELNLEVDIDAASLVETVRSST